MAREWDGAAGYYSLGSQAATDNLAQAAFTVFAWIYPQTTGEGGTGRIATHRNNTVGFSDGGGGWLFFTDGTASLGFQTVSSAPAALASQRGAANQITLNAWQPVLVTYDDAGDRKGHIYVNGTEITYGTDTAGTGAPGSDSAGDLIIGNNGDQTRTFDGYMAEPAIWTRVLAADEIAALAAGMSPAAIPRGRVAYLPLVRDVLDLHGATIASSGTHNVIDHPRVWGGYGPRGSQRASGAPQGTGQTVDVGAVGLQISGYAATVEQPHLAAPGRAQVALTAYAPAISQPHSVAPGRAQIALSANAPNVTQSLAVGPGAAQIAMAGHAPTIGQSHTVTADRAQLVVTGRAPTVAQTASVSPGLAGIVLTGLAPSVAQPRAVTPGCAQITVAGYAPAITQAPDAFTADGRLRIGPTTLQALAARIGTRTL